MVVDILSLMNEGGHHSFLRFFLKDRMRFHVKILTLEKYKERRRFFDFGKKILLSLRVDSEKNGHKTFTHVLSNNSRDFHARYITQNIDPDCPRITSMLPETRSSGHYTPLHFPRSSPVSAFFATGPSFMSLKCLF